MSPSPQSNGVTGDDPVMMRLLPVKSSESTGSTRERELQGLVSQKLGSHELGLQKTTSQEAESIPKAPVKRKRGRPRKVR